MLEPGFGRCEFLSNFQKLGLDVVGVDISKQSAKFSKNFDVNVCDVVNEQLPFNENTFDIIYSKSFIDNLYYPERYLKEAFRVLKLGGLLLTLLPDRENNYRIYFDDLTIETFYFYFIK